MQRQFKWQNDAITNARKRPKAHTWVLVSDFPTARAE